MPELPEVETVRRGLLPAMEGRRIIRAQINRPDLRWPLPERMQARLEGATIRQLRRRSKYILADLDTNETLLIHLGMSGRMLVSGAPLGVFHQTHPAPQKHDHIVLDMQDGARVTFNDARRFGAMDLMASTDQDVHWLLSKIGPEPFGNTFDAPYLVEAVRRRASPIKTILLDQRVVAGLGNIYVCEVLFRAGIDPRRQGRRIAADRIAPMVGIIRDVLSEAIEAGGSSLRDHRQTDGELGYFQHAFAVYDRAGEPCRNCGQKLQRIVQSGRSSFYCPDCQS
ncbi:bifunctional DNA-formamidopyrimidine glycosylase/DNA-(apurinic or apyrimidinic site) lyase [Rhodobacteraceae bacterium]|nr:bifunctional DNA-formamidopyrimidine glycosylase/DNA-(apurinic or apyrimidinic site) lyase [Paracoccaceae bacterium]